MWGLNMADDKLVISDANYRAECPSVDAESKRHSAENLKRAEQREQELIDNPGIITSTFVALGVGVSRLWEMLVSKKYGERSR